MTYFTQSALALAIASSCSVTTISQANEQTHVQTQKKPVEVIVVTATKENKLKSELAESIGVLNEENLNDIAPSHPAEALNRIPGVYINNLGGEGHMTSIRQPITTAGVYLFLEDGVPTRPTVFFNHNGLYEVNIVQSSAIEVTKGPGSALYGSDAIGGIINTITKASPKNSEVSVNAEMGSDAWQRVLLSLGSAIGKSHGYRFSINSTKSDTFRDEADYDRLSLSLRTDSDFGDKVQVKNIFTYSEIDQSGASDLEEDEYRHNPEKNLYHGDIGFREVDALRISSEINFHISDEQLVTVTPF